MMTMHKIFRKATTTVTGLALIGASQFALIQTAEAGPRGGVHYRGGHHGGRGGPGGADRHGGPGGPGGGHQDARHAYHAGQRQGFHRGVHHGMHHAHFHGFHVGWRPHGLFWHPIGFLLTTMAVTAIIVNANKKQYHYDQGVYYVQVDDGYRAVTAPIGANIPELPDDTQDVTVGSTTYYYYMGTFYTQDDKGFTVVTAPAGATVSYVPQGYTTQTINGTIYYEYGGVDYQPKMVDGGTAYVVAKV
jgi:hypothetical protein